MATPSYDNALGYVVEAQSEVLSAISDWKAYAYAASNAYSKAYAAQGRVLESVNKRLEEMRKEDAARMSLALSLLTVAVAGPIASTILKGKVGEVFEELAKDLEGQESAEKVIKFAGKVVEDAATDGSKKALEGVAEQVVKAYERPSAEEAFKPSGIPPDQYGDQLQEAIEQQSGVLEKLIRSYMRLGSAGMTLDKAKQLLDSILKTDFVKHPPAAVKKGDLQKKASMALWLAWAWDRDEAYWEKHSSALLFGRELSAFEPVRRVLVDELHFPASEINQSGYGSASTRGAVEDPRWGRKVTLINMTKFIDWSYSPGARAMLFSGMPMNPVGRPYAEVQMHKTLMKMTFKRLGIVQADED